jgi:serine phosphatase RsbU (regulator of sigma subunit)/anti-sigma regulatory factor (Ser/Thr protein kinase)
MGHAYGASRPAVLRLKVPGNLAEVRPASQEVGAFLAAQGCDENELMSCSLALVEAINNAICYAGPDAKDQPIMVEALVTDQTIEFRVTDHTAGFDWPREFNLPPQDRESGRGLYLIHTLSHEAGYLRGRECNVLHFLRRRSSAPLAVPSNTPEEVRLVLAENDRVISQMVEELSSCYESLASIFRHSRASHEPGRLHTFAQGLLEELVQIVGADWFLLRLVSADHAQLEVFAAQDASLYLAPLPLMSGQQVCAELEAALTRQEVWFDTRTPGGTIDPIARARPASQGVVYPFYAGEILLGTLTVARGVSQSSTLDPKTATVFTAGQASVIRTLSDFLAIQVVNARHHEEQIHAHALARELEIANEIQRSLVPKQLPPVPGLSIAAHSENARLVGGDFYDAIRTDDSSVLLVVADVMGKGVPAAMFAAILRTSLRAAPEMLQQPAELLRRANRLLFDELSAVDMFITAHLVLVNPRERQLTLATAGHSPLLVSTSQAPGFAALAPEGLPLGIQRDATFPVQTLKLGESYRLLLYTDGLSEALNENGKRYGQENLECWFAATVGQCRTAGEVRAALIQEMKRHCGQRALNDDLTFLTVCSDATT